MATVVRLHDLDLDANDAETETLIWEGSLDEFLSDNPDLDADEVRAALATKGRFVGGGGAAPIFALTVAS